MNNKGKVAVIGATGKVGRYLVDQALERGYIVRVLLRDPNKLQNKDGRVEVIKGDATDVGSIQSLLGGCHTVINAVGHPLKEKPIYSTVTTHILEIMKKAGIKRYITVTGGAVNASGDRKDLVSKVASRIMGWTYRDMMSDKQKEVDILMNSEIDWTLVRLPFIEEKPAPGQIKVSLECIPGTKISNRDIATFLVDQITEQKYSKKAPFIAN